MNTEIVKEWLINLDQNGKSQHTSAAYHRGIKHFVKWYEEIYEASLDIPLVMPRDIRNWKSHQQSIEKVSPATINQRLVAVTNFFQWAKVNDLAQDNPTEGVSTIRLNHNRPQGLKHNEVLRLLRAAYANVRDYAIIELLVHTGLRVGELLSLQVDDVVINERSGKVIVRESKGGQYREIPLTVDVRKALLAYLEQDHPDPTVVTLPLWQSRTGWLKHRSSISRLLNKYAHQAGLDTINPHQLRHTFATSYLKANPDDLRGLARLLGHRDLNTVMIYTEPDMNDLAERIQRIETLG